jgi:exopolysaccharide production protein ExoZ
MQGKLYSIQALRGLGALAVVIFHALSLFPFITFRAGAAGVDLFFVISGIVMSMSITEKTKPVGFMIRRFIRVAPMYWIATTLAIFYFASRYHMTISTEHIITSYLFLPPPAEYVLPILYPGWTLNFEMFFYLVLSILILINNNTIYTAISILLILGSISKNVSGVAGSYYLTEGLLEFALGLIIGQLIKSGYAPQKIPSIILITSSIIIFSTSSHFKSEGVIAWGIPSALLILGCLGFESSKFIRSQIVQFLGEASYSIYLFHAIAIWIIDWSFPNEHSYLIVAMAIILSLSVGSAAYQVIERPLLKLSMRTSVKNSYPQRVVCKARELGIKV